MNDDTTHSCEDGIPHPHGFQERAALSRRRFVKGAIATAPVLATLPSGAALARSSNNVVGPSSALDATDGFGNTLCLEGTGDLGAIPSGNVTRIAARDWRVAPDGATVEEADMCTNGGTYYYYDSTAWTPKEVPQGILASATALMSFAGSLTYTDI
jgi:hypothetical protein